MAHAREEVAQMTGIAQALVLNIGTLTTDLVEAMVVAGRAANEKGIPVILDAVGAGATDLRTSKTKELLDKINLSVVKGNAGEIATIADVPAEVKGVESMGVDGDVLEVGRMLSMDRKCTVVVTGKTDFVVWASGAYCIRNGHEMMGQVVGTGCMAASMIGAFTAVNREFPAAAAEALACYGVAGELAAVEAQGPGTFRERFFDKIFHLEEGIIRERSKVEEL
jgi:hydroxyethylthiazole kinase